MRPGLRLLVAALTVVALSGCLGDSGAPAETTPTETPREVPAGGGGPDTDPVDDGNYTSVKTLHADFPTEPDGNPPAEERISLPLNVTRVRLNTAFTSTLPNNVGVAPGQGDSPTITLLVNGTAIFTQVYGKGGISISVGGGGETHADFKDVSNRTREVVIRFSGWGFVSADMEVKVIVPPPGKPTEVSKDAK